MWAGFACPLREYRPRRPAGRVVDGLARIGAAWPRSPRPSPPRTAMGRGTCGPGARCPPAWSHRAPDPYPPRGQGPCARPLPGLPDGWPGNLRSFPAAACMAGGPAGRTATGRRTPGRPKRRVLRLPDPAVRRGLRTWTTASGGRRQALAGGVSLPAPGLDLCRPGEDSGTVGGSLVSAGSGATSGIASGPRLSSGFAGWPPVRGKL